LFPKENPFSLFDQCKNQCCGSGSGIGIRRFFDPRIRDTGCKKIIQIQNPGSGMNIPDLIFKNLVFFDADPDPEFGILSALDPGSGMKKVGSGINIPDPQYR
jgi:hypothetical protein